MKRVLKSWVYAVAAWMVIGLFPAPVFAATTGVFPVCDKNTDTQICQGIDGQKLFGPGSVWNKIINTFIYVIGSIASLMIVIGAFRYVTAQGEASSITAAKNTILYSIIGLIVAALSFSIVNFVLARLI
jgi:hypothetical protein